jgi:hypothetical protein
VLLLLLLLADESTGKSCKNDLKNIQKSESCLESNGVNW